jgi:hypothetical protein
LIDVRCLRAVVDDVGQLVEVRIVGGRAQQIDVGERARRTVRVAGAELTRFAIARFPRRARPGSRCRDLRRRATAGSGRSTRTSASTPTAACTAATSPARAEPDDDLFEALREGTLSADDLLRHYCTRVFLRTGSYLETARRLGIDRRTVRAKVEPSLILTGRRRIVS